MFELIPFGRRNALSGFDPFKEMANFQKSFFGTLNPYFSSGNAGSFRTDIQETDDAYVLLADLPGCRKEDISLQVEDDVLTIQAERHAEHENKEEKNGYVRIERSWGSYARSFDVSGVDTDAIGAKYENGVLTLTMPKKTPQKPAAKKLTIE